MDVTIEVWTGPGYHMAQCTCGWQRASAYQPIIECWVKNHKTEHTTHGDFVEVV